MTNCVVYERLSRNAPTLSESHILCLPCVKQGSETYIDQTSTLARNLSVILKTARLFYYTNTSLASVDQIETFLEERVYGFTTDDLVVDELVQQNSEDVYVDDSEDDLSEWQ